MEGVERGKVWMYIGKLNANVTIV